MNSLADRVEAEVAREKVAAQTQARAPSSENWPASLDAAAFHGLAGEIVKTIEPHTESDPAAILLQMLAGFGSIVGSGPYYQVEGDRHHCILDPVLVGETSKGRKGTSWGRIRALFEMVEDPWVRQRVLSGLSSGEGLIWAVRDPIENSDGEQTDEGVPDKRLLVLESEFANVLRVIEREGNTLSAILRQAWDGGVLRILTKNNAAAATDPHISIVGHITADELRRYLTRTESANGFANRLLFVCVRRSKCLPEGGGETDLVPYARRLAEAIGWARMVSRVTFDAPARAAWHAVYPRLSEGQPGLVGAVTSRSEAQTVRLAMIYALLDRSAQIRAEHLRAGLAVWQYTEDSAKYIFGSILGDPMADEILRALQAAGKAGMTRTEISTLFGRNRSAEKLGAALALLQRYGRANMTLEGTGGRAREVWRFP